MSIEQIQSFLSFPNVPDIVSYLLTIAIFIVVQFVKKFVQKDNKATLLQVNTEVCKVLKLKADMEEKDSAHQKERTEWAKEKKQILAELQTLKKAIRTT